MTKRDKWTWIQTKHGQGWFFAWANSGDIHLVPDPRVIRLLPELSLSISKLDLDDDAAVLLIKATTLVSLGTICLVPTMRSRETKRGAFGAWRVTSNQCYCSAYAFDLHSCTSKSGSPPRWPSQGNSNLNEEGSLSPVSPWSFWTFQRLSEKSENLVRQNGAQKPWSLETIETSAFTEEVMTNSIKHARI